MSYPKDKVWEFVLYEVDNRVSVYDFIAFFFNMEDSLYYGYPQNQVINLEDKLYSNCPGNPGQLLFALYCIPTMLY